MAIRYTRLIKQLTIAVLIAMEMVIGMVQRSMLETIQLQQAMNYAELQELSIIIQIDPI